MAHRAAREESKAQAWHHILKAVQVEATDDGQHFLAYLIGVAIMHLTSACPAKDLDHGERS
jgi:hypothetical protein